jgi:hypothetical protein
MNKSRRYGNSNNKKGFVSPQRQQANNLRGGENIVLGASQIFTHDGIVPVGCEAKRLRPISLYTHINTKCVAQRQNYDIIAKRPAVHNNAMKNQFDI